MALNKYAFNSFFQMGSNLHQDADLRIVIFVSSSTKAFKFVDKKFNICNFLANPTLNLLMKPFYDTIFQHSNLPRKCPIKGNILYRINDAIFSDEMLPSYVPPNINANVSIMLYERKKLFEHVIVEGSSIALTGN
ncbi:uncharacterized protein LOC142241874 [Haematobia irritans]|uniref:uncharacterized protein LOC142241874 n=1 Tax=Haematobia irritans TaxID=7368 RepID=UPI003F5065DF